MQSEAPFKEPPLVVQIARWGVDGVLSAVPRMVIAIGIVWTLVSIALTNKRNANVGDGGGGIVIMMIFLLVIIVCLLLSLFTDIKQRTFPRNIVVAMFGAGIWFATLTYSFSHTSSLIGQRQKEERAARISRALTSATSLQTVEQWRELAADIKMDRFADDGRELPQIHLLMILNNHMLARHIPARLQLAVLFDVGWAQQAFALLRDHKINPGTPDEDGELMRSLARSPWLNFEQSYDGITLKPGQFEAELLPALCANRIAINRVLTGDEGLGQLVPIIEKRPAWLGPVNDVPMAGQQVLRARWDALANGCPPPTP